jgi:iron complex transport system substrate-binding protein
VISLDPNRLGQVLDDLVTLGDACGDRERGMALRARLEARLEALRGAIRGAERPRVLALEWLDPPYVGGLWVPDMIDAAGGTVALGKRGVDSRTASWDELAAAAPDVVVAMPCGLYVEEAAQQALARRGRLEGLGTGRVVAVDAAGSFSRPGPRLVDGAELLGNVLHPDRVEQPDGLGWRELTRLPGPARL